MAKSFNLTAELNLRGPANLKTVVANIKRQLGTVNNNINLKIDPAAAKTISNITQRVETMNKVLISARKNTDNLGNALKNLSSSLGTIQSSGAGSAASLKNTTSAMTNVAKTTSQATSKMEEFGKQSYLAIKRFAAFSIVSTGIYSLVNAITSGAKAFIEFDSQIVKLQQVTGKSKAGLADLTNEITRLSTTLGVSSASLIDVASTLAQAGFNANDTRIALEALALTELAPSFDNITDTVEGSIAAIRQFGLQASDLKAALGSINAVAAAFAVESADIIAAIQRTGGVFAAASKGVSEGKDALNEFLAVFTSVRATTRESAETIATGLRTIFTRIQRVKTIDQLKQFGIELTDLEGKFVGPFEAVKRLSEGLKNLDPRDIRFSSIVEELGGFRQIGKVIPLIQQFATAQEALKIAQRGQDSLIGAQITAQQSLAVQLAKVREQFLALIREIGQSAAFQNLFKIVTSLASGLISLVGAFKPILPILGLLGAIKGVGAITKFASGFIGELNKGSARGTGQNIGSSITGSKEKERADTNAKVVDALRSNTDALKNLTSSINSLNNTINSRGTAGLNDGGPVRKFARGGVVPGSGNRDTVPAMLTPGEFVIRKKAVETIGAGNLQRMNKYAVGGKIKKDKDILSYGSENIVDGDTFAAEAITDKQYRLKSVDAVESGTKYGSDAKKILKNNKNQLIDSVVKSSGGAYGRGLFENDQIAKTLVSKGYGVPDYRFTKGYSKELETAQKEGRGIWSEGNDNHPKRILFDAGHSQEKAKELTASRGLDIQKTTKNKWGRFAAGGKALGARRRLRDLDAKELDELSTSDLIMYAKAQALDIFSSGGSGMAVGNEFIEVPAERITPELDKDLVTYMGKKGFWKEIVAPFGQPIQAKPLGPSAKQLSKMGKEEALAAQMSKYSDEVAAREQQWTSIRSGSAIDNYLLGSLQDPILSDYKTVRGGGTLAKTFHNTRLRQAVNKALEEYDDFDYSGKTLDTLISNFAAKKMSFGGSIKRFAEGMTATSGKISQEILNRIKALGSKTGIVSLVPDAVSAASKATGISANQLFKTNVLGAMPDGSRFAPYIEKVLDEAEKAKGGKEQAKREQLDRNMRAAAGGAYQFGLVSLFGPNGQLGYESTSDAKELTGKNGEKFLTQVIRKSLPTRYADAIKSIQEDLAGVSVRGAEKFQYTDIFGTGGPLAFDFDDTLVKGADIFAPNGGIDIRAYNDLEKVKEALTNAELTLLGKELSKRITDYPQLMDSIRVLTARPPSNAPLLAAKLSELQLPIPESKITGVTGGLNKVQNLSELETLIDDNLANIESVIAGGKRGYQYNEPQAANDPASAKNMSVMQGYALEQLVKSLGVNVSPDDADPNRPIDFPSGLGPSASKWGIRSTLPTDTKRTNDSSALTRLWAEAERYFVEKFANGGQAGISSKDTVPALLTPGEFVINKKAAQKIGYSKLEKLNKADKIQGYNKGGLVSNIQRFVEGGVAEKQASRLYGSEIKDIKEAEKIFAISLGSLSSALKQEVLKNFKGIEQVVGGGRTGFGSKFAKTNLGMASYRQTGNQTETLMSLQLGGKHAAKTSVVSHETGHLVDTALGGGKGLSSKNKGSFQFELAEKAKPIMEKAYRESGLYSEKMMKYLTSNAELFAEFYSHASPDVKAIITSTTDAKIGMEKLAQHLGDIGSTFAGLQASDLINGLTPGGGGGGGGGGPGGGSPPGGGGGPPGGGTPGNAKNNADTARAEQLEFFAYKAKEAGYSVEKYQRTLAKEAARLAKDLQVNLKNRLLDLKFTSTNIGAGLKGRSRTGPDDDKNFIRKAEETLLEKLKAIKPDLPLKDLEIQASSLVDELINANGSFEEAINKVNGLSDVMDTTYSTTKALSTALQQLSEETGIAVEVLATQGVRRDAVQRMDPAGNIAATFGDIVDDLGGPIRVAGIAATVLADRARALIVSLDSNTQQNVTLMTAMGGFIGAMQGMVAGQVIGQQGGQLLERAFPNIEGLGRRFEIASTAVGLFIGAVNGAFDAFYRANLDKILSDVSKSAVNVDAAFENLSRNNTPEAFDKAQKALADSSANIANLADAANFGAGGSTRTALEWMRGLDPTGMTSAISGAATEQEARDQLIGTIGSQVGRAQQLGEVRIGQVDPKQIRESVDRIQEFDKQISELKAAGGAGADAAIKDIENAKNDFLSSRSQVFGQLRQIYKTDKDAFLALYIEQAQRSGLTAQQISDAIKTPEGLEQAIQKGKELSAMYAEQEQRARLLSDAVRSVTLQTENILNTYRLLEAGLTRFSQNIQAIVNDTTSFTDAMRGQASIRMPERIDQQILENMSAFSTQDVAGAAQRAGQLVGGGQFGNDLANRVNSAKFLQDALPNVLQNTTGQDAKQIMTELSDQFAAAGLKLDPAVFEELSRTLEAKLIGKDDGTNVAELASDPEILGSLTKIAEASAKTAANVVKAFYDAMGSAINLTNDYSKALQEATEYQLKAADIRIRSELQLSEALGEYSSLDQMNAPFDARIKGLSTSSILPGGSTDPKQLQNALTNLVSERKTQEDELARRMSAVGSAQDPAAKAEAEQAVKDQMQAMAKQNVQINNTRQALEELANDSSAASNALQKLSDYRAATKAGVNLTQEILTADSDKLRDINKQLNAYNKVITGRASGKDMANVQFRQQAFGGLDMLRNVMPEKIAQQMQAKMSRQMLTSMGVDLGQTIAIGPDNQKITLDQALTNVETGKDPQQEAYIEAYRQATERQARAADALAESARIMGDQILQGSQKIFDALSQAIQPTPGQPGVTDAAPALGQQGAAAVAASTPPPKPPETPDGPAADKSLVPVEKFNNGIASLVEGFAAQSQESTWAVAASVIANATAAAIGAALLRSDIGRMIGGAIFRGGAGGAAAAGDAASAAGGAGGLAGQAAGVARGATAAYGAYVALGWAESVLDLARDWDGKMAEVAQYAESQSTKGYVDQVINNLIDPGNAMFQAIQEFGTLISYGANEAGKTFGIVKNDLAEAENRIKENVKKQNIGTNYEKLGAGKDGVTNQTRARDRAIDLVAIETAQKVQKEGGSVQDLNKALGYNSGFKTIEEFIANRQEQVESNTRAGKEQFTTGTPGYQAIAEQEAKRDEVFNQATTEYMARAREEQQRASEQYTEKQTQKESIPQKPEETKTKTETEVATQKATEPKTETKKPETETKKTEATTETKTAATVAAKEVSQQTSAGGMCCGDVSSLLKAILDTLKAQTGMAPITAPAVAVSTTAQTQAATKPVLTTEVTTENIKPTEEPVVSKTPEQQKAIEDKKKADKTFADKYRQEYPQDTATANKIEGGGSNLELRSAKGEQLSELQQYELDQSRRDEYFRRRNAGETDLDYDQMVYARQQRALEYDNKDKPSTTRDGIRPNTRDTRTLQDPNNLRLSQTQTAQTTSLLPVEIVKNKKEQQKRLEELKKKGAYRTDSQGLPTGRNYQEQGEYMSLQKANTTPYQQRQQSRREAYLSRFRPEVRERMLTDDEKAARRYNNTQTNTVSEPVPTTPVPVSKPSTISTQQASAPATSTPNGQGYALTVDQKATQFLTDLTKTFTSFNDYITRLETVSATIPKTIDLVLVAEPVEVNVNLTGAAVIEELKKSPDVIKEMVDATLSNSINKEINSIKRWIKTVSGTDLSPGQ